MIIFQVTIEELAPETVRVYAHAGSVAFPHGEATPLEVETAERLVRKFGEAKAEVQAAGKEVIQLQPQTTIAKHLANPEESA